MLYDGREGMQHAPSVLNVTSVTQPAIARPLDTAQSSRVVWEHSIDFESLRPGKREGTLGQSESPSANQRKGCSSASRVSHAKTHAFRANCIPCQMGQKPGRCSQGRRSPRTYPLPSGLRSRRTPVEPTPPSRNPRVSDPDLGPRKILNTRASVFSGCPSQARALHALVEAGGRNLV